MLETLRSGLEWSGSTQAEGLEIYAFGFQRSRDPDRSNGLRVLARQILEVEDLAV